MGTDKIEDLDVATLKLDGETVDQTVARLIKGDYAKYSWTQIKRT